MSTGISVSLPVDGDGMIGRQCPSDICTPRYFKIQASAPIPDGADNTAQHSGLHTETEITDDAEEDESQELRCPYCGHTEPIHAFATPQQIEYAKSVAFRVFMAQFQQTLKSMERTPDPDALISIGVSVSLSDLPALATYQEEHLKQRVTCLGCSQVYAVYGVSFHCPYCGAPTILEHIAASRRAIDAMIHLPAVAIDALDIHARDLWLSSAAGQVVSLWEGYLKAIYRRSIIDRKTPEEATRLENSIGTTFQRIEGASRRFHDDLGLDLLTPLTDNERQSLSRFFQKRHVFTHNLGLADARYQSQTQSGQVGQEVVVTPDEIIEVLALVDRVLDYVAQETWPHAIIPSVSNGGDGVSDHEGDGMAITGVFDPNTAPMPVQTALATYINVIVNGGYDGGSPAAEYDCRAKLKLLACDDDYIESAIAHANKLGDEGWRKKYGYA